MNRGIALRIIFAIPHYVGLSPEALRRKHGSTANRAAQRGEKLRATILALHQTFGTRQSVMQICQRRTMAANTSTRADLRVVVCTVAQHHALDQAAIPPGLVEHCEVDKPPQWLGFACHELLAEHIQWADWFAYLEDDLLVQDALWWQKLNWFIETAGVDAVLQPNRFERGAGPLAHRAYVDGRLKEDTTRRFQQRSDRAQFHAKTLGRQWRFVRPSNPHSGCFFLRADQMGHWMGTPDFAQPSREFIGPLESAATLGLMRSFRIYKPARQNAGFLEIEHQSRQFISQLRRK